MNKRIFVAALSAVLIPSAVFAQTISRPIQGYSNPVPGSNADLLLQTGSTNTAGMAVDNTNFSPVGSSTQSLAMTAGAASQRLMMSLGSGVTGNSMTYVQFEMQVGNTPTGTQAYRIRLNETAPAFAEQMGTQFWSVNPASFTAGVYSRAMVGYSSAGLTTYSAQFTSDARYIYNPLTPGTWYRFLYVMDHGNGVTSGPIVQRYNTTTSAYETLYGFPWNAGNNGIFDVNENLVTPFTNFKSFTFGFDGTGSDAVIRHDNIVVAGNADGAGRVKATIQYEGFVGHDNSVSDNVYIDGRTRYTSNFVPYMSGTMYFKDTTTGNVFFWPCDVSAETAADTGEYYGYVGPGTYDVFFAPDSSVRAQNHWLMKKVGTVTVAAGATADAGSATLLNGDVDGDNEVSILDYIALSTAYGSSVTADATAWELLDGDNIAPYMSDLDEDGEVSILDYLLLSANFGQSGDTPF